MADIIPSKEEMLLSLTERHGEELQKKFSSSVVAVCGLGGLGSNIAVSLARAGIGRLILIDFDRVDVSNLNRQQYKACQVGLEKPYAMKENLLEIAPYSDFTAYSVKITQENAGKLLEDADIICEAFDKAEEKAMLCDFVSENMRDKYYISSSGMAGLGTANSIKTKKITDKFYLCGDLSSDVEQCGTLYSSRVMLCAAHEANAVLRIIAEKFDV